MRAPILFRTSRQGFGAITLAIAILFCPSAVRAAEVLNEDACGVALTAHSGDTPIDREIAARQAKAASGADRAAQLERLGWAYVRKARTSHDPGFFVLAQQVALCIRGSDRDSLDAMLLEAHALHNLHRFREATVLARQLVARRSRWYDHALLGDVLMEQGDLEGAVASYQQAMDLRPGPQVYSRAAHVRWLKGDVNGAVAMMRAAASSVNGRDRESAAWTYSRLAFYDLQRGHYDAALQWADGALSLQPDSAPALFVRGRIRLARGAVNAAVADLTEASSRNPLPEYRWALAEALIADGRNDEAEKVEAALTATGSADDPRTLALYLATRGDQASTALRLARRELKARHDVFTYDALAWALLATGHVQPAYVSMRRAVAQGTEDARIFFHAAAIAAAAGRPEEAEQWRQHAARLAHMLLPSERNHLTRLANQQAHAKEGTS